MTEASKKQYIGSCFYKASGTITNFNKETKQEVEIQADDVLYVEDLRKGKQSTFLGYSRSTGTFGSWAIDLKTAVQYSCDDPLFFDCECMEIKKKARKQWIIEKLERLELTWAYYTFEHKVGYSTIETDTIKVVFHRKKGDKIYALPYQRHAVFTKEQEHQAVNFNKVDIDSISAPIIEEILITDNFNVIAALWGPYLPYITRRVDLIQTELKKGDSYVKDMIGHMDRLRDCRDLKLVTGNAKNQPTRDEAFTKIQGKLQQYQIPQKADMIVQLWKELQNNLTEFTQSLPKEFIDSFLKDRV